MCVEERERERDGCSNNDRKRRRIAVTAVSHDRPLSDRRAANRKPQDEVEAGLHVDLFCSFTEAT